MSRLRDICGEFFATLRRADFGLFAATSALSLLSILTLAGGYPVFGLKVVLMQAGATLVGIIVMFLSRRWITGQSPRSSGYIFMPQGCFCSLPHCSSAQARARIKAGFLSPACPSEYSPQSLSSQYFCSPSHIIFSV